MTKDFTQTSVAPATDDFIAAWEENLDGDTVWDDCHIASLIARIRASEPVWQDIATAPRGGKRILLVLQNGRVCEGYWGAAKYNRKTKEYERAWVSSPNSGELQATHWQPLPSPPKPISYEGEQS